MKISIGKVYNHNSFGPIYVTSGGSYNVWSWKQVNENGTLSSKTYQGLLGHALTEELEVEITVLVKILEPLIRN